MKDNGSSKEVSAQVCSDDPTCFFNKKGKCEAVAKYYKFCSENEWADPIRAQSEAKTVKAVKVLKSFFRVSKVVIKKGIAACKWANENVTVGMAVKVGFILLFVSAVISSYLSAVF